MAASKKTPKKSGDKPATKSKSGAKKPAAPKKAQEAADPAKQLSPAERKAALEAFLEQQGIDEPINLAKSPKPADPMPPTVREVSPAERKAHVEQLVEESGVAGVLRKAPWKRSGPSPAAPPTAPATPAAPEPRRPRATMTKAPIEPTAGRSPPRTVILDSNALMMQFQFHVDIEKEVHRILNFNHEIIVPTIVVDELARIAKEGNAKEQAEARMAIELAKTFRVVESPGDGDTGILRLAEKENAVVVTNDKVLRARLRAKDIANIYMRSRAFLTLEGHIPGM